MTQQGRTAEPGEQHTPVTPGMNLILARPLLSLPGTNNGIEEGIVTWWMQKKRLAITCLCREQMAVLKFAPQLGPKEDRKHYSHNRVAQPVPLKI